MQMIKILTIIGTRPEVVKMAPIIHEFKKYSNKIKCRVCVTGQHKEMVDPLLKLFHIRVGHNANIMRCDQTLNDITAKVLSYVTKIIRREKPDYLMVQGDTTTTMAASLAAFYGPEFCRYRKVQA
jgi:UDP-N-acetylglucosamine 2-epimerase (non-hydrolysing)